MKKIVILIIVLMALPVIAFTQEDMAQLEKGSIEKINMDFAIKNMQQRKDYVAPKFEIKQENKKSVFLAGLLSAAVPGAGEFYTENYWQSALFLGLEAASWIINIKYNKKGDDQTTFFQGYANEHWSVLRYANWVERNINNLVPEQKLLDDVTPLLQQLYKSGTKDWEKVNWDVLNQIERLIGQSSGKGQGFSHSLPHYGQQQYFELIGKYHQFCQGWDDSDQNGEGEFINHATERLKYYSTERGKANDYYSTATTFASIIVVNHIVSAIDAALMAYFHNKARVNVSYDGTVTPYGKIELSPKVNLSINF